MAQDKAKSTRPGLRQRLEEARDVAQHPRTLPRYIERGLVRMWRSRGGSWYGIGYVCTFLYLEARMMVEDFVEAPDVISFATSQIFETLVRWLTESIGNMIQAFLWPLSLISSVGLWLGVALLVGIHFLFEYMVRPLAEARFPELQSDRLQREQEKDKKKSQTKEK